MSDLRRQASRVPLRSTNTAPHGQVAPRVRGPSLAPIKYRRLLYQ
jgi:hypothetical protein